jgi:hypothetical protein
VDTAAVAVAAVAAVIIGTMARTMTRVVARTMTRVVARAGMYRGWWRWCKLGRFVRSCRKVKTKMH